MCTSATIGDLEGLETGIAMGLSVNMVDERGGFVTGVVVVTVDGWGVVAPSVFVGTQMVMAMEIVTRPPCPTRTQGTARFTTRARMGRRSWWSDA